jgi:lipoprotein-anchoring transpeptidase ErfK/SrfK
VLALALVSTWTIPPSDLASSPERAGSVASGRAQSPAERYAAVRARGAPVAVVHRRTALRAAPSANAPRLAVIGRRTAFRSTRALAVADRRGGWLRVIAAELPNGERGWIRMSATRLVADPWRISADLSDRELTVTRAGRVVRRFSVAVGGPATPTPTGRFAVTDKIRFTTGSQAYGCCAVAISGHQPHIEQGWAGGDRLAIHATLQSGTIGYAASHGCLRARNEDVRWLLEHVLLGTVVEFKP